MDWLIRQGLDFSLAALTFIFMNEILEKKICIYHMQFWCLLIMRRRLWYFWGQAMSPDSIWQSVKRLEFPLKLTLTCYRTLSCEPDSDICFGDENLVFLVFDKNKRMSNGILSEHSTMLWANIVSKELHVPPFVLKSNINRFSLVRHVLPPLTTLCIQVTLNSFTDVTWSHHVNGTSLFATGAIGPVVCTGLVYYNINTIINANLCHTHGATLILCCLCTPAIRLNNPYD